ncbi:hypothetical protein [Ferruginibacter sp. HRS2-29]|uniref:hypothetical protein n=1 Tax=Ferruginibacter sp. HRS2-29 TaxID=2487334 RepID=UPI0020CFDC85|nr:hypothetical protein [Ferruginibacter sp. HRS2-29]MCP9751369.1 hypothetical protein [Ferruginibacter sp. HRS2-29]
MKKISVAAKSATLLILVILSSFFAKAALKPGMLIAGQFDNNTKTIFVAAVTSVNGKQFTCRFVQSNVEYVFTSNEEGEGTVVSSKGGKYAKGTKFLFVEYQISDDTYGCLISRKENTEVIARFPDNKSYLGTIYSFNEEGGFTVMFTHSLSVYDFDKNGVVVSQKGGAYPKGTPAKIFCAELVGPVPVGMTLPKP